MNRYSPDAAAAAALGVGKHDNAISAADAAVFGTPAIALGSSACPDDSPPAYRPQLFAYINRL